MIGISRLSWSLAEHRQLPKVFARLHRRYRTPWFTIVFFSAIACLLLLQGSNSFLGNVYSFGAMMSFTIAHASVVILRVRQPDAERPYKLGGNVRIRGYEIPVGAVVGGLGTFATWVSLIVLHGDARYIGAGWLTVGVVGYFLYRRRIGCDPWETHRLPHRLPPAWFKELEYGSALVPLFSSDVDGSALRAAASSSARTPRSTASTSCAFRATCRSTRTSKRRSRSASACSRPRASPAAAPA